MRMATGRAVLVSRVGVVATTTVADMAVVDRLSTTTVVAVAMAAMKEDTTIVLRMEVAVLPAKTMEKNRQGLIRLLPMGM